MKHLSSLAVAMSLQEAVTSPSFDALSSVAGCGRPWGRVRLLAPWAKAVLTPGAEDTAVPGGWREMPCPSVVLEPSLSVALAKFGCVTSEPFPMVKDKKPLLPLP